MLSHSRSQQVGVGGSELLHVCMISEAMEVDSVHACSINTSHAIHRADINLQFAEDFTLFP